MCLLHILPYCGNAFLGVLVGSQCPWTWVIFGMRDMLHFPVSYIMAWVPWCVVDYGGPWRPGWTRCLVLLSWGGSLYYLYHINIYIIDTCLCYWRLQGIYLLGLLLFSSCCRWYMWTLCCCVVSVVLLVATPFNVISWLTWFSSLFGAWDPCLLPLMGVDAC